MGTFIVHHEGAYNVFSTIPDAFYFETALTLDELQIWYRQRYGEEGMAELPGRLERAHASGSSAQAGPWAGLENSISGNRAGLNESTLSVEECIRRFLALPASERVNADSAGKLDCWSTNEEEFYPDLEEALEMLLDDPHSYSEHHPKWSLDVNGGTLAGSRLEIYRGRGRQVRAKEAAPPIVDALEEQLYEIFGEEFMPTVPDDLQERFERWIAEHIRLGFVVEQTWPVTVELQADGRWNEVEKGESSR